MCFEAINFNDTNFGLMKLHCEYGQSWTIDDTISLNSLYCIGFVNSKL